MCGIWGNTQDTYIWHIWKLGNSPANTIQIERERVHRVFQASDSLFEFVYIWFYLIILIVKQSTHFDFENESSLMLNLKVICVRTLLCCSHGSTFGYSLSLSVSWKHSSTKWCQPTDPDRNLLQGPLQAWYLTNISVLDWLVVLCLQHNQFLIIIPGCLLGSTSFKQIIWCLFYTYIYNYIYSKIYLAGWVFQTCFCFLAMVEDP